MTLALEILRAALTLSPVLRPAALEVLKAFRTQDPFAARRAFEEVMRLQFVARNS